MDTHTLTSFITAGKERSKIDVPISYRIIDLFSQGLYRSPNKAIEELVSNSFDAGATKVHVILPPDFVSKEASIAVIDNGTGMGESELEQLWRIGVSNKRDDSQKFPKNRKQIGKFGIGKLATYVLCYKLTHISKYKSTYYATTMDYTKIPEGNEITVDKEERIQLPLRELTEEEAKEALSPFLRGTKPGYTELKLFGTGAAETWTFAIMSDLKKMARDLKRGRLQWILETAMPLRDDFKLYFNGDPIRPSKLDKEKIGYWVIGKDIKEVPQPAPDELEVTIDEKQGKKSRHRFGLTNPQLGRITGYVELYKDPLTVGDYSNTGRSHGFFVYVHERLVNIEDEYFGIDSNLLRHGTFARFRTVVHIDNLDTGLRSSRESILEDDLLDTARYILRGIFNYVRMELTKFEESQAPGVRTVGRIAVTPINLTITPLLNLITKAIEGNYAPRYTTYPRDLSKKKQSEFIENFENKAKKDKLPIREVVIADDLMQNQGIALFDAETGILKINAFHPFVAHFLDEYERTKHNVSLELLGASEVFLEAYLLQSGLNVAAVGDILSMRDDLLRSLACSTEKRNALIISRALSDASTNEKTLEKELLAAFDSIGFYVTKLSGPGKPDGIAEAHLGISEGKPKSYKVTIEAKSKEKIGTKVSAKDANLSGIVRNRKKYNADYTAIVGPDFPTTRGKDSAFAIEIKDDRSKNPNKGVTLIRVEDMARLVRIVPAKCIGLDRIQKLFQECSLPEETQQWIEHIGSEKVDKLQYEALLDAIVAEQKARPNQAVEYAHIQTRLSLEKKIELNKDNIRTMCKTLSSLVPELVTTLETTIELKQRPDKILNTIQSRLKQYSE